MSCYKVCGYCVTFPREMINCVLTDKRLTSLLPDGKQVSLLIVGVTKEELLLNVISSAAGRTGWST